ncbi:hypothetical protein C8R42DRAFT_642905 [Lentinula raphanica]|nr:hypothetical protein C8R42DRAFT_642905 [Lentinula raphanica]
MSTPAQPHPTPKHCPTSATLGREPIAGDQEETLSRRRKGVSMLHAGSIVHGDLKHENVLVCLIRDSFALAKYVAKISDSEGIETGILSTLNRVACIIPREDGWSSTLDARLSSVTNPTRSRRNEEEQGGRWWVNPQPVPWRSGILSVPFVCGHPAQVEFGDT